MNLILLREVLMGSPSAVRRAGSGMGGASDDVTDSFVGSPSGRG